MGKYSSRVAALKEFLLSKNVDAILLTSEDAHGSETPLPSYDMRKFFLNFRSSAGKILLYKETKTKVKVALFIDCRYIIAARKAFAKKDVDVIESGEVKFADFISSKKIKSICVDSNTISYLNLRTLTRKLEAHGCKLWYEPPGYAQFLKKLGYKESKTKAPKLISQFCRPSDLVDKKELSPLFDEKKIESETKKRLASIYSYLIEKKLDSVLISDLELVAYLLDMRGSDIPYNAVFYSYLLLTKEKRGVLFLRNKKISPAVSNFLRSLNISVASYPTNLVPLTLPLEQKSSVAIDEKTIAMSALAQIRNGGFAIKNVKPLFDDLLVKKATLSTSQIKYLEASLLSESLATFYLYNFLCKKNKFFSNISESCIAKLNHHYRKIAAKKVIGKNQIISPSFEAIAAIDANAAQVHHHPCKKSKLKPDSMLLLDFGGLYLRATTDTTRVFYFGSKKQLNKKASESYTNVYLGNKFLEEFEFPFEADGSFLDSKISAFLKKRGIEYGHGSGHGVGCGLGVHSSPIGISKRNRHNFSSRVLVTNEPGFYVENEFGIRYENILLCTKVSDEKFGFKNMTLFPVEVGLLDFSILTMEDKRKILSYNMSVLKKLWPYLKKNEIEFYKKRFLF